MLTPFGQGLVLGLALVNAAGFGAFGMDKWRARRGSRRTPEKTLVMLALCGGWAGAWLGVKVFRHKSSKRSFQVKLAVGTLGSLTSWAALGWWELLPAILA